MLCDRGRPEDRGRAQDLANEALGEARELGMSGALETCLALKLSLQGVDSSDTTSSIYTVASAVQRERPDLASHAAPDGNVTIMFSDMEGFTSMTERLGDAASLRIVSEHNAIVRQQLRDHGGHELELQGDGFMLAFPSSQDALRCAVAIQRAFGDYNQGHADQPVHVRIGLHCGEAIADAEKFFGLTVILAARIAAQARGGEIVVSQVVRDAWETEHDGEGAMTFVEPRDVELKGISEPLRICSVGWR
jgi:class 3 adenylate cyclase